jgi:hypothetical protein
MTFAIISEFPTDKIDPPPTARAVGTVVCAAIGLGIDLGSTMPWVASFSASMAEKSTAVTVEIRMAKKVDFFIAVKF